MEDELAAKTNAEKIERSIICSQSKVPTTPGELPATVDKTIQRLGGTLTIRLASKKLKAYDIRPRLMRFLLPRCDDALHEIMTPKEWESVVVTDGRKKGLNVKVVDPKGKVCGLALKYWTSIHGFVLTGKNWIKLAVDNKLNQSDTVNVWCFHSSLPSSQLCFAISIERI